MDELSLFLELRSLGIERNDLRVMAPAAEVSSMITSPLLRGICHGKCFRAIQELHSIGIHVEQWRMCAPGEA